MMTGGTLESTQAAHAPPEAKPSTLDAGRTEEKHDLTGFARLHEVADSPSGTPWDLGQSATSLSALNDALCSAKIEDDFRFQPVTVNRLDLSALQGLSFRVGKRVFDVLFAAFALVVLSPVLLLCVAAIWAESPGPVLFRQRRLGKGGHAFWILKFRTMIPNAESVLNRVLDSDPKAREDWARDHKLRNDPRITRLGRFLRRASLDELPQFLNVLAGDMSIVGPRPIVNAEISRYDRAYSVYCAGRPGITGLWQVSGRNDSGYARRVALDCKYLTSWSPGLDLSILFKTIRAVICGPGAY
jgi:lipopolysaccharide/colanic/teichoic acid biosynthesis glycosyltransferase